MENECAANKAPLRRGFLFAVAKGSIWVDDKPVPPWEWRPSCHVQQPSFIFDAREKT
jgi:hypothetical protein